MCVKNARRGFSRSTIATAWARERWVGWGLGRRRVEDEDVQSFEQGNAGFGNLADVRDISCVTKAESENRQIAMHYRHRGDFQAPQIKRSFDKMRIEFDHAAKG